MGFSSSTILILAALIGLGALAARFFRSIRRNVSPIRIVVRHPRRQQGSRNE